MKTLDVSIENSCQNLWLGFVASMVAALVVLGFVGPARADVPPFGPPIQEVPGLTIRGLEAYQGKYLTVLYAHAWAPAVKTDNRQVLIQEVLKRVLTPVTQASVQIAPAEVAASGLLAFNHLFLVVHDQPDFVWKNANDASPQSSSNAMVSLVVLSKSEIDLLVVQQGDSRNITVQVP